MASTVPPHSAGGGVSRGCSTRCPNPWCGRARLKYAAYSLRTLRRWHSPTISLWLRHSRRTLPRKRSHVALARGARTGVRSTRIPLAAASRSKHSPYLRSLSRMRKRGRSSKGVASRSCDEREERPEPEVDDLEEVAVRDVTAGHPRALTRPCPPAPQPCPIQDFRLTFRGVSLYFPACDDSVSLKNRRDSHNYEGLGSQPDSHFPDVGAKNARRPSSVGRAAVS
jgi:hypothetical protein